ncbi:MAG TPA: hypothetical protein G4O00_10125 [Thermoflexia bacterium]|jgi:hypothetical protein|nr:hypothetical protein [Thermoflexia bacterium]
MRTIHFLALALILLLPLAVVGGRVSGLALDGDSLHRPREVLGSGASAASAEGVSLRGTLGQPVVGVVSAEEVSLGQGFWHGSATGHRIYLPLMMRDSP